MRRTLVISAATVVGCLGGVGWEVGTASAGADVDPPAVIALTPDAAAMRWLDDGRPPPPAAAPDAAGPTDPGAVAQTITVSIQPGPLVLIEPPTTLTLHRVGATPRFRGAIAGLRLADMRAEEPGWELSMRFDGIEGATSADRLRVRVERIDAFADTVDGVSAGHRGSVHSGDTVVVARAQPGSGHGSWDVTAVVDAVLPHVQDDVVVAHVAFVAR